MENINQNSNPNLNANMKEELEAMQRIVDVLNSLDNQAKARVLNWAYSALLNKTVSESSLIQEKNIEMNDETKKTFDSLADLFVAASPKSHIERALVSAYWIQFINEVQTWTANDINKPLRELGYGVPEISKVLIRAQESKSPALVIRLSKNGKTPQSKKTYKLTNAGMEYVKGMLKNAQK